MVHVPWERRRQGFGGLMNEMKGTLETFGGSLPTSISPDPTRRSLRLRRSATPHPTQATNMRPFIPLLSLLLSLSQVEAKAVDSNLFSPLVQSKVYTTASKIPNPVTYPQYTNQAGTWQWFGPDTWTSGFFPSTLYALDERQTLCPQVKHYDWLTLGRAWSTGIYKLRTGNGQGHDQGFLSFPFARELQINPTNATAKDAINSFAKLLAARFNPIIGCTKSWDNSNPQIFQVIIDNMVNLELLFQSADFTGNQTLRDIAISHADKTMKNHIRADGSTWHVVEYSITTGAVTKKHTSQGYSDDSTWSRGQAWGIYGFAKMYERTKKAAYLETAQRLADYFISHIPANGVVPWDYQAPLNPAPRPSDSSAAMIASSAFLLLSSLDTQQKTKWQDAAIKLINDNTKLSWNTKFQSLLSNGTVNWPAGNLLTGTVYGDYYFIQSGNDLVKKGLAEC